MRKFDFKVIALTTILLNITHTLLSVLETEKGAKKKGGINLNNNKS